MAYDEGLAARATEALGDQDGLVEKRIFGGIGYLIHGNMACGVNRDSLIVASGRLSMKMRWPSRTPASST